MKEKQHSIAVYGLGNSTKEILKRAGKHVHIVGLLDGYRTEGEMYGMPILSMEELPARNVTAVLVAARPASKRIIVNRIAGFCKAHGIKIIDAEGNELSVRAAGSPVSFTAGTDRREIMDKMDAHEVISFDVFDTLLMRRTLYPSDVFEIVERMGMTRMPSFAKERQVAEWELGRKAALLGRIPGLDGIYGYLAEKNGLSAAETERLKRAELEVEKRLAEPRREVCGLLRYAVEQGKKVYLVSDMYLSAGQIGELLKKCGITGYEKILVSCEYGTGKEGALFSFLREEAGTASVLHLGDSKEADAEAPARYGMDGILLPNALDLFEKSGLSGKLDRQDTLEERVKLGMFLARFFNSPFLPDTGRRAVREPEDLGYLLFAPMLTDFTVWLWQRVKESGEKTVLFGARDGFLIRQMFDVLQEKAGHAVEGLYFLTSRTSAVFAGIRKEEDVDDAVGMGFGGSRKEMLRTRFLLTEEEMEKCGGEAAKEKSLILEKADEKRMNYLTYVRKLGLEKGKKAFFDFVSTGTCQLALEKLFGEKMQGYYFMRLMEAGSGGEKNQLRIHGFYPSPSRERPEGIYGDYLILENILTSPDPSLQEFDRDGRPLYLPEHRSEGELSFLGKVHAGILSYFREYLDLWESGAAGGTFAWEGLTGSRELSEMLLGLVHGIPVENEVFLGMEWTDSFYGRKAGIRELL